MKKLGVYIIIILFIGCSGNSDICGELTDVQYVVKHYGANMEKVNYTEYYNNQDQILRCWRPGEEIRNYKYDGSDKLIQIEYSRKCQSVFEYEYQVYNENNQLIGQYRSKEPKTNLDSIDVSETLFYSDNGLLTRELKIDQNKANEIVESKNFYYGATNRIDSILITRGNIKSIEINKYDERNRLIRTDIYNKTRIIFNDPRFDGMDTGTSNLYKSRTYEYNDEENTIIEKLIGDDGQIILTKIEQITYKI